MNPLKVLWNVFLKILYYVNLLGCALLGSFLIISVTMIVLSTPVFAWLIIEGNRSEALRKEATAQIQIGMPRDELQALVDDTWWQYYECPERDIYLFGNRHPVLTDYVSLYYGDANAQHAQRLQAVEEFLDSSTLQFYDDHCATIEQ